MNGAARMFTNQSVHSAQQAAYFVDVKSKLELMGFAHPLGIESLPLVESMLLQLICA